MNLPQQLWVVVVGLDKHINLVRGRQLQFRFDIDLLPGRHDPRRNLRPDAAHLLQLALACGEHCPGRAKHRQQILPMPRPNARYQRQPDAIDKSRRYRVFQP